MTDFNIQSFSPITNAAITTDGHLMIEGTLTVEIADKTNGWVMDYAESKKYFEDWFSEIHNASMLSTNGTAPSWGNVRLMHGSKNVGKIAAPPVFDDANKRILTKVMVTDTETIAKARNGELIGFSWSGVKMPVPTPVMQKWASMPDGGARYIGRPFELTITDNPNQKGAYFRILNTVEGFNLTNEKGEVEFITFKSDDTIDEIANAVVSKLKEGEKKMADEVKPITMEQVTNAATAAVTSASTALLEQVKALLAPLATAITEIKNSVEANKVEVKNSVDAYKVEVNGILAKIPEPSTIVTRTKEEVTTNPKVDFAQIENATGKKLDEGDKKLLGMINELTFGTVKA